MDEQYEGRFYERLQDAWGNEWNTRLDLVLQGNNDGWLIEQIRNESYTLQAGNKRYELANHLGNVLAVVRDKKVQTDGVVWQAEVVSAQDFFPFGMSMPGRSSGSYRYTFNGKETDPETGLNDFGARLYDPRLGRWLAVDLSFKKYAALSPFTAMGNNPVIYKDPDGKDIVFFNAQGVEIGGTRIKSTTIYETYVDITPHMGGLAIGMKGQPLENGGYAGFEKADMPGLITIPDAVTENGTNIPAAVATDPKYQEHDYLIAAKTHLFNQKLATATDADQVVNNKHPENKKGVTSHHYGGAFPKKIDVNLVKAIAMQETKVATDPKSADGLRDMMKVNVFNDWGKSGDLKKAVGLTKADPAMTVDKSLDAFFLYIFHKGFLGGSLTTITTDHDKGTEAYYHQWNTSAPDDPLGGWSNAVSNYNGGGKTTYLKEVTQQAASAKTNPKPDATNHRQ